MKAYNRTQAHATARIETRIQICDEEIANAIRIAEERTARTEELLRTYTEAELWKMYQNADNIEDYNVYGHAWSIAYENEQIAYREKYEDELWHFYRTHKDDEEHEWWDFFSDWHKDVYGVRPH